MSVDDIFSLAQSAKPITASAAGERLQGGRGGRSWSAGLLALMDTVASGILVLKAGKILYANYAVEQFTGYSGDELTTMSADEWADMLDPVSRKFILSTSQESLSTAGGEASKLEVCCRTKEGAMRWGAMTLGAIDYEGGPAALVTIVDITERRQIEIALRDNEEKFRALSQMVSLTIIIIQDWQILYINPAGEKMIGRRGEELMAMTREEWTSFFDRQSCQFLRSLDTEQLAMAGEMPEREVSFVLSDGTARWGAMTMGILEYGGNLALLATIFDITERKRAEETIRDTSRYLADIINESPDAMLIVDKDGWIRSFNRSASRLFKYQAGDVIGTSLSALLPNGEVNLAATKSYVQEFSARDGSPLQLSVSVSRLNGDTTGVAKDYIVTLKDLSEISGLKITPTCEKAVDTAPLYTIESGTIYVAERMAGDRHLEIFADQVKHNVQGLCVTRHSPGKIRQRYGLEKTPMIWLTGNESASGEICMKPDNLSGLGATLQKFMSAANNGFILIEGVEYLISRTNFDTVLKFIQYLDDRVMVSNCSVLIALDPLSIDERQYHMLTSELKPFFKESDSKQDDD